MTLILIIGTPVQYVDESLINYYKKFVSIVKKECPSLELPNQLIIETGNLSDDNIGVCVTFSFRKHITIDKFYWLTSNEQSKKQLMYHELTHCVLGLHHIESELNYMNPYIIEISEEALEEQLKQNTRGICNE